MNPSPMQERLASLLRDYFEVDPQLLRPDAPLDELGMDSLSLAELLTILEEEDGVPLPEIPSSLTKQTTLAEVVRIIEEQRAAAQAGPDGGEPAPADGGTVPADGKRVLADGKAALVDGGTVSPSQDRTADQSVTQ
ncbi:acyl carrier protein [Streptomyces minutiscleroticus]|uniref:Carrier domain-containing protein n=1 Tax=Streptomyces minutiscleroticus TaxID=68238 RepID=A0A918KD45_9ACTN|nr:acyl carrier protein [Streptomyces minutiscleroticus]GGX59150.1 hypothetical protein GCM10010358_11800 [Streptomyces minutiscleroticus]